MNPLTHAHFVLEIFKGHNLTQDEKDHLIVGSILPDIHITGLIQFQKTHNLGLDYFHSAKNPLHKFLALGIISHGEEPKGLDYHTHQGEGYIQKKQGKVLELAKKYQNYLGEIDDMTAHHLIEFSMDNLIAEINPLISQQVLTAFQNPKMNLAIASFSHFLGFSERKNMKIIKLLNNKHVLDYFQNCSLPETTAKNWLNLTFYRNMKKGKNLPLREKIKKFTAFSYYNMKRTLNDKQLTQLFEEINNYLREDAYSFLSQSQKEMILLKNGLL